MNYTQATKYLHRACKRGYVPYHNGIVSNEELTGNINHQKVKYNYGINIDGDGHKGRYFGYPIIIWDAIIAEEKFPKIQRQKK